MKRNGLWHFDKDIIEPQFKVIGKFVGEWQNSIKNISFDDEKCLNTAMRHRVKGSHLDEIHSGNISDSLSCGYPANLVYGHVYDEKWSQSVLPAVFHSMRKNLPLRDTYIKATKQLPGQLWPFHFDNYHALRSNEDRSWNDPRIRRILVALEDWDWGHYCLFGNAVWHNWKAGEILYFDWLVPHATANCGHRPRHTLFITGTITDELESWVNSGDYRTISV
jgi:hypothetical protein